MKRTLYFISFVLLVVLLTSVSLPVNQDGSQLEPASNEVIFYQHSNYGGYYFKWFYDRDAAYLTSYNMGSSQTSWNDQISSVKIGKDVCVTFWEHVKYAGAKIQMKADGINIKKYASMPSGWNDKASSVKIRMYDNCSSK